MKPGKYISIEGIDGAGKSTQIDTLYSKFMKLGSIFFPAVEPTDQPIGRLIRQYLTTGKEVVTEEAMALLFAADRRVHLEHYVKPKLNHGQNVMSDRCVVSSIAYQSLKLDFQWICDINGLGPGEQQILLPDAIVYLNVSFDVRAERLNKRGAPRERYEGANLDFYNKLSQNYQDALDLVESHGTKVINVNADQDENKVTEDIIEGLSGFVLV